MKNLSVVFTIFFCSISFSQTITDLHYNDLSDIPKIGYLDRWDHTIGTKSFVIDDINLDGRRDIIVNVDRDDANYKAIHIYTNDKQVLDILTVYNDIIAIAVVSLSPGEVKGIIAASIRNQYDVYLTLYAFTDKRIREIKSVKILSGFDQNRDGVWDLKGEYNVFFQTPERPDKTYLVLNTGYDLYPRGVYQIDITSLSVDWRFEIGAPPRYLIFDDSDDNGELEILFVTSAPDNHYSRSGICDSLSYLFRISEKGQLLNNRKLATKITFPYLDKHYYNKNSFDYIIAVNSRDSDRPKPNYVQILDRSTLDVKSEFNVGNLIDHVRLPYYIGSGALLGQKFPLAFSDGQFFTADPQLENITEFNSEIRIDRILSLDLDNDDYWEYLFYNSKTGHTIVTNSNLEILGYQDLIPYIDLHVMHDKEFNHANLFFLSDEKNDYLYEWHLPVSLVEDHGSLFSFFKIFYPWMLSVLIGIIGLYWVAKALRRYRKRRDHQFSEDDFRRYLLRNQKKGIIILDNQLIVSEYNQCLAEMFYLENGLFVGKPLTAMTTKINFPALFDKLSDQLNNHFDLPGEAEILLTHNTPARKFLCSIGQIKLMSGRKQYVIELLDLTRLTLSEQLAAWGGLTQRMAHEIKNPLTTLLLTLRQIQRKFIQKYPDEREKFDNYINSASEEINRLRNSINTLMKFSSTIEDNASEMDINHLIKECLILFKQYDAVKINHVLKDDLPKLYLSEEKMRQVIYHLLENSLDAIENDGEITITTNVIERIVDRMSRVKSYVELEITDTGQGIPDNLMSRIFEPDFTTKATGSGFGLAIIKFVIDQFNGEIKVKSKIHTGTTFTIILPVEENLIRQG